MPRSVFFSVTLTLVLQKRGKKTLLYFQEALVSILVTYIVKLLTVWQYNQTTKKVLLTGFVKFHPNMKSCFNCTIMYHHLLFHKDFDVVVNKKKYVEICGRYNISLQCR